MPQDNIVIKTEATSAVNEGGRDPKDLSLEALTLLINLERLSALQEETEKNLKEIKERREKITKLHEILQAVNSSIDEKGELDLSKHPELTSLLQKAKELGCTIPEGTQFNLRQQERLVENIRMVVDDLNMQNDMQIQKVTRLTNERYESYQMARSILKPLHEAKISNARAVSGRGA